MRLTLRTMLAYLDDCLDPADAEVLRKKIDESEFANGLVHRIRNSMRKLRLAAPKLEGKGLGVDPNTVAEYLETTLSPETVPDFEKVCLESDVHLAEVAACHQILALVLKEPAEVAPELRERIYRVEEKPKPSQVETAAKSTGPPALPHGPPPPSVPQTKPPSLPRDRPSETAPHEEEHPPATYAQPAAKEEKPVTRAKPEIPDYLRAGEKRFVPLIVTALLVFLVLSVLFFAIGPDRIVSWFGGGDQEAPATPDGDQPDDQAVPAKSKEKKPPTAPAPQDRDVEESDEPRGPAAATDGDARPPVDTPLPADATDDGEPEDGGVTDTGKPPLTPPMPPDIPGVEPSPEPAVDNGEPVPADTTGDEPVVELPAEPKPEVGVDIGFFTAENQVLARYDQESGAWHRLATNTRVSPGDRLLVPPTYRPQLTFATGVEATLIGPAQFNVDAAAEVPHIDVEYGRTILYTIGKPGAQISLNLGGKQGVATCVTADSSMAVEVQHYRPPGVDPQAGPVHLIVHVVALRGEIVWEHENGTETLGELGVAMHFDDREVQTGQLETPPKWIEAARLNNPKFSSDEKNIQEFGSPVVERLIDRRRPLVIPLEETLDHSNIEVRALVAHALSQLGNHEPLFALLTDKSNKAFWDYDFDVAQQALARSPQSAAEVLVALEKVRGEDGRKLYRLLWGYSPEQLDDPSVTMQLVDYLDHEAMEFRVLTSINLRRITGMSLFYRPEATDRVRAGQVQSWREALAKGEITYDEPPRPPTLLPLPAAPAG